MSSANHSVTEKIPGLLSRNFVDLFQQSQGRYPALDGLRAIAILLVIFFHCFYLTHTSIAPADRPQLLQEMSPWLNWVWQGDKGVDLFFVLSGFLISMLLLKEHSKTGRVDVKRFYQRRVARIVPAYLILLAVAWIAGLPNREWVWGNLLFVNNMQPSGTLFVPWSWSITVEAQFYLLFPLLLLPLIVKSKRPLVIAALTVVICVLLRQIVLSLNGNLANLPFHEILFDTKTLAAWWDALYIHLHTRGGPIALGIAAGVIHSYHGEQLDQFAHTYRKGYALIMGAALALFITTLSLPVHIAESDYLNHIGTLGNWLFLGQHRNLFSLSIAVLLLISIHPASTTSPFSRILRSRILTPVAKVSYSAYLFHIFIIWQVFKYLKIHWPGGIGEPGWYAVGVAATLILTLAASALSYVLVEKPFIDLAAHQASENRR